MWKAESFIHCWWEYKNGATRLENGLQFPIKLNMQLPSIASLPLDIYPRGRKHAYTKFCP